jgi:hypothetical protein
MVARVEGQRNDLVPSPWNTVLILDIWTDDLMPMDTRTIIDPHRTFCQLSGSRQCFWDADIRFHSKVPEMWQLGSRDRRESKLDQMTGDCEAGLYG